MGLRHRDIRVPDPVRVSKGPVRTALSAVALMVVLSGCATLERGTVEQLYVVTDPPGAKATFSNGGACITPCGIEVNRLDKVFVGVEKDGYAPQQAEVDTKSIASAAAVSQEVTFDYAGRLLDHRGGANVIHVPNPVVLKLIKNPPPE